MIRARCLRGYIAFMSGLDVDPAPLLRRHCIALEPLDDGDALLPLGAVVHLLEESSVRTGCRDLGLRIAKVQDTSVLGALGVILRGVSFLEQAVANISSYVFAHNPALALTVRDRGIVTKGAVEVAVEMPLPGEYARQSIDLCLGMAHRIAKLLLGRHYHLRAVTLCHRPLAPLNEYRRFFGAPVVVGQERAALHLDAAGCHNAISQRNPGLRRITEEYLSHHFRGPHDSASARVRLALRRMLGSPRLRKADIAAMLGVHPRTLQRHLHMEGTSFESIKLGLRQELAMHYLCETGISLGQLSGLLGYPDQTSFARSFRHWFNMSPTAFRKSRTKKASIK